MATALPKPPAAELAAIAARAKAAGFKPTQAAILATYNKNQAKAAAKPATAGAPKPPASTANASALDRNAIIARAQAAGKKPTTAAVNATLARNKERIATKARAKKVMAPEGNFRPTQTDLPTPAFEGPLASDPGTADAYWNDFLARLKAGETPKQIEESNAARFGGQVFPGQGPEQNLSSDAYAGQVLQQYEGSPTLDDIRVNQSMSPKAWLAYLKKVGVKGYQGGNSGQQDPEEFARMIEHAGVTAGLKGGRYGFGYDDKGRRLSVAELIAALDAAGIGG